MNAKTELLDLSNDEITTDQFKCALIEYVADITENVNKSRNIVLKLNYTNKDLDTFLDKLNFNYNNRSGSQRLFGTIWLNDNTWVTREIHDYHGNFIEWWTHNVLPNIPSECL